MCTLNIYFHGEKKKNQYFSLEKKVPYLEQNVYEFQPNLQGPVVQSVVSLTSSLRVISLTVLADSIQYSDIFC